MADFATRAVRRFRRWMRTLDTPASEAELDAFVEKLREESRVQALTPRQHAMVERALADARREGSPRVAGEHGHGPGTATS
jgi:hypothetical protein